MLQYSRDVPHDIDDFDSAFVATVEHVREHLSSCVDSDDDGNRLYSDVTLEYADLGNCTRITGSLDGDIPEYALDAVPVLPADGEEVIA